MGEVEQLLGILHQNCSLGFRLRNVEAARVDRNLGLGSVFDDSCTLKELCPGDYGLTLWFATKHHSPDDSASIQSTTEHLDHTDGIDVEVLWVLWHDGKTGFSNERREDLLRTRLLRSEGGRASGGELFLRWEWG